MYNKNKVLLMILDGFGISEKTEGNAVKMADMPFYNSMLKKYPHISINSFGLDVGLPEGQMGNSEVGHLNIGAGKIVFQDITRINLSVDDKSFFENKTLLKAFENVKENNSKLHLIGLVSDGGVHSYPKHYYALIDLAKKHKIDKLFMHALTDGRDTSPTGGKDFVQDVQDYMNKQNIGKVATITGRYYTMDRDKRWERVEKGYLALTEGIGEKFHTIQEAFESSYSQNITDEFITPKIIVDEKDNPLTIIEDNDSVIFFNFRADRARQISHAFLDDDFNGFNRKKKLDLYYVSMTEYEADLKTHIAFPPQKHKNILGEIISKEGLHQLRIAETEKYAHVTFFFNGGVEKAFTYEDRELIPSPKVATYDLQPEMSAPKVTEKLVQAIESEKYEFIVLNFANPDMVGHTGIIPAAVKALETIDKLVKKIVEKFQEINKDKGYILLTADHGNAEQMIDPETKEEFTAHTTNPVPFMVINPEKKITLTESGRLADIAPTVLKIMNIEKPEEMTGNSLVSKID